MDIAALVNVYALRRVRGGVIEFAEGVARARSMNRRDHVWNDKHTYTYKVQTLRQTSPAAKPQSV